MTTKRDSKSKPKKDERPKIKKEKLRDLEPGTTDLVKGGMGASGHGRCYTEGCTAPDRCINASG